MVIGKYDVDRFYKIVKGMEKMKKALNVVIIVTVKT